jgi:hypothetical protein
VTPAAADSFMVQILQKPITAGNADMVFVTAVDQYGNQGAVYTGKVHFTSSDGAAVLPVDYTFMAAEKGSHVFSATFNTVGNQSLTVRDSINTAITGSDDVDVV